MKKRILAIQVSTWEALENTAVEHAPVIHVDHTLYAQNPARAWETLGRQGYVLSARKGRSGVFFLLSTGENRFCHDTHEIEDPLGIL